MANTPFHIEAFLLENGTIDTSKYLVKVARGTLHPGVVSMFLTEAIGVDESVEDAKLAHGYIRGSRAHAWVLPAAKVQAFNEYLAKFNVMTLVNHLKALRAKIGPSTPKVKPVLTSVPMPTVEDDEDDSYDPETDSDLD